MTYKSFCQVVILGSSNYVPFMQLSAADRRLVVENLLDIDVFSVMNTLVRSRLQMTKEYVKDIDTKIEIAKSKVDEKQKLIDTLEKKSSDSVDKYHNLTERFVCHLQNLLFKNLLVVSRLCILVKHVTILVDFKLLWF